VVLDCHVLAFDVAGFAEAFAERGHIAQEASAESPRINPTTGSVGCCALAASGRVNAAPPRRVMKSRLAMSIAI
jgi:hypothetical protein